MSYVCRKSYDDLLKATNDEQMAKDMKQLKWSTVHVAISDKDLKEYFKFLNDAVVLRPSREGVLL